MKRNQRATFKLQVSQAEQDFEAWKARNFLRILQTGIEVEQEWIRHLHKSGVDTSNFPGEDIFIPELGITHHRVFFPDALKTRFHAWFTQQYLPQRNSAERGGGPPCTAP